MKDRKVAGRYARALLGTLPQEGAVESADAFLAMLREMFDSSDAFRDLLLNPAVPRSMRKSALRRIAEDAEMPPQMGNFLATIVDHNRSSALPLIAALFHEERENRAGIVAAEIVTAQPLSDEMRQRTLEAIERMTGRRVRLGTRIEPEILGGAVTRIGSTIYDGSLRTQLAQLRRGLTQD
jgi:F-type H+-transporting ATPase subunit delta